MRLKMREREEVIMEIRDRLPAGRKEGKREDLGSGGESHRLPAPVCGATEFPPLQVPGSSISSLTAAALNWGRAWIGIHE